MTVPYPEVPTLGIEQVGRAAGMVGFYVTLKSTHICIYNHIVI